MGFDLYQTQPVSRAVFDQADQQLGFALSDLCFNGPEESLVDTINQQPALLVTSIAILRAMQAAGSADPEYVAGHSMGEFSALVAAGSISFADGLALVRRRGELMKEAGEKQPGAMAAIIALETDQVEAICAEAGEKTGKPVQVANDNCPGQKVISGDEAAVTEAMSLAQDAGARKVVQLPISIAAHSELMRSAADAFAQAVNDTPISPPRMPIIGNVSAQPLTTPAAIRAELKAQLTAPVRWIESMTYLTGQGVDTVFEVGPGDVLLGLMKRIDRSVSRQKSDFQQTS
jgi:[acyl-carrier-protein] S-malonyltransferase